MKARTFWFKIRPLFSKMVIKDQILRSLKNYLSSVEAWPFKFKRALSLLTDRALILKANPKSTWWWTKTRVLTKTRFITKSRRILRRIRYKVRTAENMKQRRMSSHLNSFTCPLWPGLWTNLGIILLLTPNATKFKRSWIWPKKIKKGWGTESRNFFQKIWCQDTFANVWKLKIR